MSNNNLLIKYQELSLEKKFDHDDQHLNLIHHLQNLIHNLNARNQKHFLKRILTYFIKYPSLKGFYLYGPVGSGKTTLMDLFYNNLNMSKKRRVHFYTFISEIHALLHQWRTKQKIKDENSAIDYVVKNLIQKFTVLCFDEFFITNIVDAMLIKRIFTKLWDNDVVIILTSNFAPKDLYKDGLKREYLMPFIQLIDNHMHVMHLTGRDYRRTLQHVENFYYYPANDDTENQMAKIFSLYAQKETPKSTLLSIQGRSIVIPRATSNIVWFYFSDLCDQPLSPTDYLTIAQQYRLIILSYIPDLTFISKDSLKRFISLIDVLYDQKNILFCSAEVDLKSLYKGEEFQFEFQRTLSRLYEMQSKPYVSFLQNIL
ncbi:MAG: AFG1 family ATPase [Alphaproteobacteria bacterium]|nr:AFG1 family ATPase [Alphaproteobacteria bacterium]